MARIYYTGIVSKIEGSIAGTTFQRNASSYCVKARSNYRFSSSSAQTGTQSRFSTVVTRWRSLSLADRAAWRLWAAAYPRTNKWGAAKTLSGFQYHAASNRNLLTIGQDMIDQPVGTGVQLSVEDYDAYVDSSSFDLNWSVPFDFTDYQLLVFASAPTQRLASASRVSKRLILQSSSSPVSSLDILSAYLAVYPLSWADLVTYGHCFIKLYVCTVELVSGLVSPFNAWQAEIG